MTGKVIKSTGSWYSVLGNDGQAYECRIKGKFRIKGIKSTNPIAVGDIVDFELEPGEPTAVIIHLHDRENYIIRKSVNLSRQTQIIAANMDQAILVVTLAAPRTSLGFIDRFLVTAEAYHIPSILVFNKYDLYDDPEKYLLNEVKAIYENIGYPCYEISALNGYHIDQVNELLKDKTTLFSGHSGVGKSSLINAICPEKQLRTAAISEAHQKGMHTTTFAEMFALPNGGFVIDTPGIRELGVVEIEPEELSGYFPEMRQFSEECKFNNCTHIHEPGCAVLKAVDEDLIAPSRYDSYVSIFHNFDSRA
ncbi:ribosome small subunit-dependent GTPase A [Solitalea canadensis]|uniref:Small ribosomal subunit biogenesis GTPase RsgA n=1 Tax=Solitalea canadensis (strain ATCC 29591 / DSM 3403 / JCM 21819 / LMG 8368 / NBRC 15130 / NCIMB 12057 / USAM 9D) TaxID=929556 RepID=H8KWP6_SOLCM|nr:ribosome small subunit-dependent GTPase A [Solitalea canadensis]AFD08225.1 ribosome small subunit-dependent GTPase A [Solitalea canadensis DSM 3403]